MRMWPGVLCLGRGNGHRSPTGLGEDVFLVPSQLPLEAGLGCEKASFVVPPTPGGWTSTWDRHLGLGRSLQSGLSGPLGFVKPASGCYCRDGSVQLRGEAAFEKWGQAQGRLEVTGSAASLVEPWAMGAETHLKDGKGQCGWDLGGSSLWLRMEVLGDQVSPRGEASTHCPLHTAETGVEGRNCRGPSLREQMKWGADHPSTCTCMGGDLQGPGQLQVW